MTIKKSPALYKKSRAFLYSTKRRIDCRIILRGGILFVDRFLLNIGFDFLIA